MARRLRFRTSFQSRYLSTWDHDFLRAVKRHAEVLWLWTPGVFTTQTFMPRLEPDGKQTRAMERMGGHLFPDRGRTHAFAMLPPTTLVTAHLGDAACRERIWASESGNRLARMIYVLRKELGVEIGALAEDYAAGPWMRCENPPDYLILDTPMICARDKNNKLGRLVLSRSGVLRRGRHSRLNLSRIITARPRFRHDPPPWFRLPEATLRVGHWGPMSRESMTGWVPSVLEAIECDQMPSHKAPTRDP